VRRGIALLGVLAGLAGCQSWRGVPDAELPEQPIAIYYRTSEEAQRLADAYQEQRSAEAPPDGSPTLVGSKALLHADMDALGTFLTNAFGADRGQPDADRGRLALLDPRSEQVDVVEGALRGSVPLAWKPDHETLLFAQSPAPESSDVQIFEWSASADTVRRVTVGPPIHSQACYGPDERIVVTAVDTSGSIPASRIRISQPGGRGPYTDLSSGPADHSPTCAPDGDAVAFARGNGARSEIWLVAAPFDAAPRALAPGRHPRFSARGDWLVYTAMRGRASRIFRVRADGSGRAPIGRGARDEAWPSASPDGKLVAYVATEDAPRSRLLVRRFDGTGDRILLSSGEGLHPVW
jgi:Tol biopolymer transport system component